MRRTNNYYGNDNGMGQPQRSDQMLEEENDRLTESLSGKVKALKSLSIDIGHEVRTQNKLLQEMDDDFDTSGSLLSATMGRLSALTKKGHHKVMCYMILFCFFVFLVAWYFVRRR
ncbi:BET1 homolog isoform X2 [Nematostella vectensis]|uniref:BET1 homolog isoform X2 n=1 Tax=Nematostella vectensis TaxID=45351 RepID=UPI0013901A95|nr:BET1 homolog isoform X2 [Nematostella vectensis]